MAILKGQAGQVQLVGEDSSGAQQEVAVEEGVLSVAAEITGPLSAFGDVVTSDITPVAQAEAVYGLINSVETFIDATPGTGSVDTNSGNFRCQTGTGVGGYGVIRTSRPVPYRPGQGCVYRFTALFDHANRVANSLQFVGAYSSTNGFVVGYDGANSFGVMHRTGGQHEIRVITLSAGASGAETLTLTLNSVGYSIPLTSGTTAHNAYEIEQWLNDSANQGVWEAYQNANTVVLFGLNVGALSGTYSFSSSGTAAATIAQTTAGATNTETWVYQGSFTHDQLDGTGPSRMTIDTEKGNVFEIALPYLGYGAVDVKIQNPETRRFFTFHRWKFPNSRTTPILNNPTLKVGMAAASLGSTTNLTVQAGSFMGGIYGKLLPQERSRGVSNQKASISTTLTSIVAIRVRSVFNGAVQLAEFLPKIISVGAEAGKSVTIKVLLNPTFASNTNWQYVEEDQSIIEYDTTGGTFSNVGTEVATFVVFGDSSAPPFYFSEIDGDGGGTFLQRGDVLCVAAVAQSGPSATVTASITGVRG